MKIIPDDQVDEFELAMKKIDELSRRGGYGAILILVNMHDLAWVKNIPEEFLPAIAKRWLDNLENPQVEKPAPVMVMSRGGSS